MDIKTLETDGLVYVPYPPVLRQAVKGAVESWKQFCSLPLQIKKKFSKKTPRHVDYGYVRRDGNGEDLKEYFHVKRCQLGEMEQSARSIRDSRSTAFIEGVGTLIERSIPLVLEFASLTEEHYRIRGFIKSVRDSTDLWTFRYIHYLPGSSVLALPHADRGGFTLHNFEDHEGGGYYSPMDRKWHKWDLNGDQTIFFPSMTLQYRSLGKLLALWHRVLSRPHSIKNGAYSMVTFVDFNNPFKWDTERMGNIQDLPLGFNYDMPFNEFKKCFIRDNR